jgi:hypothetical protein
LALLLILFFTDLFPNVHHFAAKVLEGVVIFHLMFQASDFFQVMKSSAEGSTFFLTGKEGIRAGEDRFGLGFGFAFYELAGYRATAHFFDEGDLG